VWVHETRGKPAKTSQKLENNANARAEQMDERRAHLAGGRRGINDGMLSGDWVRVSGHSFHAMAGLEKHNGRCVKHELESHLCSWGTVRTKTIGWPDLLIDEERLGNWRHGHDPVEWLMETVDFPWFNRTLSYRNCFITKYLGKYMSLDFESLVFDEIWRKMHPPWLLW
jgi:hypothetical protein